MTNEQFNALVKLIQHMISWHEQRYAEPAHYAAVIDALRPIITETL